MSPDARAALKVVAGFALARLGFALSLGLGIDESYTQVVARKLQLSYFDHPPLHLWIAHFAALAFGEGVSVRLPFVALFALTGWMAFALARRLFGPRAALIALFSLNAAPFFFASAGAWVVPDGPMLCALAAAALLLERIFFGEAGEAWAKWLGAGLCLGLAGLAKYNAVFPALGVVLFVALSPRQRRWLRRPEPYAGALLALLVFSPALAWNAENGWISFAFQSARGAADGAWRPERPLAMALGEAALLSPWLFAPLAMAGAAALRGGWRDEHKAFLLCLALPAIAAFTLAPLWGQRGLPHWPMPGWFFVFPLLGAWLNEGWARGRDLTRWALACAALMGALAIGAAAQASSGWLTWAFDPKAIGGVDPTLEAMGWDALRGAPALAKPPAFVVAARWSDGGKIGLALGPATPVLIFSQDPRGLAFLHDSAEFVGADGVVVVRAKDLAATLAAIAPYFADLGEPQSLRLARADGAGIDLALVPAHGLTRRFALPYPR